MEDLSKLCRVCLLQPELEEILDLSLIYDEEEHLTYSDCFQICTKIDLSDGGKELPHNLCKQCGLELQVAYDFHKKVEDSKRYLNAVNGGEEFCEGLEQEEDRTDDKIIALLPPTTKVEKTDDEVVLASTVLELEETDHLEFEEYQAVEHLEDDEDAETIQTQFGGTKVDGDGGGDDIDTAESYIIETIAESEVDAETLAHDDTNMSWEQAVVTVANESHLPLSAQTNSDKYKILSCGDDMDGYYEDSNEISDDVNDASDPRIKKPRKRFTGKYRCNYCQKLFPNHSRMLLHRRSHDPDRPKFTCADCGRIYATKQAMEVHERTSHSKSGFPCGICGKIYAIKKSLEIHMRYHTGDFPYVCDICGKKFAQLCHLNTHNKVKHNSVRFSCEHPNCGKFFTSSASLRNHEFSHGDMPFECEYCQRGYPAKSKLKVHIRVKHGKDLTLDDLEHMRKFHVQRSKLNLVKVIEP